MASTEAIFFAYGLIMAGASLLSLIDDIASLLDDVGVMTRVTAQKAVGLLGDDLALNAEQVTGVAASRELPVVWKVTKGSLLNKAILIPLALALNSFLPWLTIPLLMMGGLFLTYEGFHKVYEKFFGGHLVKKENPLTTTLTPEEFEKKRVLGAIRTDFILSAEIIVISLGEVLQKPLVEQAIVLVIIAVLLTFFVYGVVAFIVKIDDIGAHLVGKGGRYAKFGHFIVKLAPKLMRILGIVGTIAMFLVGGGIFSHNVEVLHHLITDLVAATGLNESIVSMLFNFILGILLGAIVMVLLTPIQGIVGFFKKNNNPG